MMETSILLCRQHAMGDVALTTPIAQALRESGARISLLTGDEALSLAKSCRDFDEVFTPEDPVIGRRSFDLAVDLHARAAPLPYRFEMAIQSVHAKAWRRVSPMVDGLSTRGVNEHAVAFYARLVGLESVSERCTGRIVAPSSGCVPVDVLLAPGSRFPWTRWDPSRYIELYRTLDSDGYSAAIIGHKFDSAVLTYFQNAGLRVIMANSTAELLSWLPLTRVLVANASGLSHIAAATEGGPSIVSIHSHASPGRWRAWGTRHKSLNPQLENVSACTCEGMPLDVATVPCGKTIPVSAVADTVRNICDEQGSLGRVGNEKREL